MTRPERQINVNLRVGPELKDVIRKHCNLAGISMSDFTRRALVNQLERDTNYVPPDGKEMLQAYVDIGTIEMLGKICGGLKCSLSGAANLLLSVGICKLLEINIDHLVARQQTNGSTAAAPSQEGTDASDAA